MSKTEPYRGEDQILERIRTKYKELCAKHNLDHSEHAWDVAVESVMVDFTAEGLMNSADEASKHQTKNYLVHVSQPLIDCA